VLAEVYLALNDIESAANQAEFLSRRDATIANNLRRLIGKRRIDSWGDQADKEGAPVTDMAVLLASVKAKNKSLDTYQTYVMIGDGKIPVVAWDVDYVAPDRFSVEQGVWRDQGVVLNKWIAVSGEVFTFLGAWIRDSERVSGYDDLSEKLRIDKWLDMLSEGNNVVAERISVNEVPKIRLEFEPARVRGFFRQPITENVTKQTVAIWLDQDSKFIQRAVLTVGTVDEKEKPIEVIYEQTFFNQNLDLKVEVPENVVESGQLGRASADPAPTTNDGDTSE
ncbi:MAG: hypothetical protein K8I00_08390, partial [Candidatus Omnitrophica bacterium]|nr:hypothetical protein [Candidatus Omnitrophota bacterium]